jgi:hypothetical protein
LQLAQKLAPRLNACRFSAGAKPMADLTIRGLIERVLTGTIRIPKFQRAFVWEPERVAFLMDSIYRGYPVGSVLLWRSEQKLNAERDLGPFKLPEPEKKWPIDYVLDGQQRLTSLFGVFQTSLTPKQDGEAFEVYFDLAANEGVLEDQFVAATDEELPPASSLFPLRLLFDPARFAQATRDLPEPDLKRVVELQRRFQEFKINSEVIEFKEREQIAMIFERVNRAGVPLDTFQLLTAWTWSEEFDLAEKVEQLGTSVAPYGFSQIGKEEDLLLKCCSAIIAGDASVQSIVSLHGPTVRDQFDVIERAILSAIEFLRKELNVQSLEIFPYPAMLVSLARFFRTESTSGYHPTAKQRRALIQWFWASCFSRRYSSGVNKAHAVDIAWMDHLRNDENTKLHIVGSLDPLFFFSTFNIGTVNTKVFVLMLASMKPKSLISGARVDLENVLLRCNRNEFHHIFPKAFVQKAKNIDSEDVDRVNCLSNFCFLSSSDNQKIKDKDPKDYINLIPVAQRDSNFQRAILPNGWSGMNFRDFYASRMELLAHKAAELSSLDSSRASIIRHIFRSTPGILRKPS